MLDLVKKEHLTKEELSRLDTYLSLNVEAMVTVLDNKDIIRIIDLIKHGSLDAFLDCLDFAPIGVIDLLKSLAVTVPLDDYQKRQALKAKTGFDVDTALKNIAAEKAEDETANSLIQSSGRRIKPAEEVAAPGRRTAGTSYKIIKTETAE